MPARTITTDERRARLGLRHGLAVPGGTLEAVTNVLVALHATDPAAIYLALSARMDAVSVAEVGAAMFDRGTMLRTLAMRRTLFVVTTELAPLVEISSSIAVAATGSRSACG